MTSIAVPSELTAADGVRRRRLRTMRVVATSLLAVAAVVFFLTREGVGWAGFVHAGAEAAMVGAIADWFAVAALFKRPLGLPIPHTALIPRKKEQLGASLQDFVSDNFLRPHVVRERVEHAEVSARLGRWLATPRQARRLVDEGSQILADVLEAVGDDDVEAVVGDVLIPRLLDEPLSPAAGQILQQLIAERAHHGVVDAVLTELGGWMDRHPERLTVLVLERAPAWSPEWANRLVADKLRREARAWVADISADRHHRARVALDQWLTELADALQHEPATMASAERLKARLLTQPRAVPTAVGAWHVLREALVAALRDADGLVRRRAVEEVERFAGRLQSDVVLRDRVDLAARDAAAAVVQRYGGELATVISATIERWDGHEAARRIELHVGRDLQFIRINGTVVGGLVGVLLHAVTLMW